MPKQTDTSRRHMLRALGVAGLAASVGDVLALTLSGGASQRETSSIQRLPLQKEPVAPAPVSASDPMVTRAMQAARTAQLGKMRVALRLDSSTAHRSAHEFKLPSELARRAGGNTVAIEAVTLRISDTASTKALGARLTDLKMRESLRDQAFYFVRARRAGKTNDSGEYNFVLGLAESGAGVVAIVMRVDNLAKIPGWTLVSGFLGGGRRPGQGAVGVQPSPPEDGEEEDKDFVKCYLDTLTVFLPLASPFVVAFCAACVTAVAALPATAGASSIVSIPSCVICAAGLGAIFAVPAALCLGEV